MAFVSQERKKELAPAIRAALKKYGIKGTIGVDNHSSLVVNIKSGDIDFIANYNETSIAAPGPTRLVTSGHVSVNHFWYHEHFTGEARDFLKELLDAMNGVGTNDENFDKSDSMTDYFHVGWYVDVNIGKWNKPYVLSES